MKRYILNSYFVLLCFVLQAQVNLVPNYSFEDYNTCPNSSAYSLTLSSNWLNATTSGTPDYLNKCSSFTSIPSNAEGYQNPKTGNAYAGMFIWVGPTVSGGLEYAQVKLKDSLKSGKKYCLSYFVSRAENEADYAISDFGGYFSDTILNVSTSFNINVIPQVKNSIGNYKMNYTEWEEISGLYNAVGNEIYLVIGNFSPTNLSDTLFNPYNVNNSCRVYCRVYYFIDDVTVEEVADAQAGNDKLIICGDSVVLGADSTIGAYYKWTPSAGLSNDSVAFPIAQPTITTTYVLRKQQCHIVTYDTVQVAVNGICPVGINELINDYNIKVYPTPTNEELMIELNLNSSKQNLTLSIYNIIGELVKKQNLQNGTSKIDVSDLKSGTYLYRISIDDYKVKKDKLIIIK